jgi:hypothetical protein
MMLKFYFVKTEMPVKVSQNIKKAQSAAVAA